MADKNEGFTGTEVVEKGTRQNTTVTNMGPQQNTVNLRNTSQHIDGGNQMYNHGVEALAGSIQAIAGVAQENWREETTNKLAIKAKAMQGTDVAINKIAETKKRNPFMKAVMGESVTTRVTEAQSIQNATTRLFNHANEEMPKLAHLSTDEAIERMAQKSEDLVAEIKDPALRQFALDNMLAQAPLLAEAHYKERYALQRNKQVENNRENILLGLEALDAQMRGAASPEEKMEILGRANQNVFKPNDPEGAQQDPQSLAEYRGMVIDQAASSLQGGDQKLYQVLKSIHPDRPDALTKVELDALDNSVKAFDGHTYTMGASVVNGAELSFMSANTKMEFTASVQQARLELERWAGKGSGSELHRKNVQQRKLQLEKAIARDAGQWAVNAVESQRKAQLFDYYGKSNNEQAQLKAQLNLTKADERFLSNDQVNIMIAQQTGWTYEQASLVSSSVLEEGVQYEQEDGQGNKSTRYMNPVVFAQNYSKFSKGRPMPDVFQDYADNTLLGMDTAKAEDGVSFSEKQIQEFRVTEALVEGNPNAMNWSGAQWADYHMIKNGIGVETVSANADRRAQYKKNAQMVDTTGVTRKDRLSNTKTIVEDLIGGKVSNRVMSNYQAVYDRTLQSAGYDEKTAKDIFSSIVLNSGSIVAGTRVENGKALDEAIGGQYTLDAMLTGGGDVMVDVGNGQQMSILTPMMEAFYGATTDKDQKILMDGSRIRFTKIEFIPGDDSVEFTPVGGSSARIPIDQFKSISKAMAKHAEKEKMTKAIEDQVETQLLTQAGRTISSMTGTGPVFEAAGIAKQWYEKQAIPVTKELYKRAKEPTLEAAEYVVKQFKRWTD